MIKRHELIKRIKEKRGKVDGKGLFGRGISKLKKHELVELNEMLDNMTGKKEPVEIPVKEEMVDIPLDDCYDKEMDELEREQKKIEEELRLLHTNNDENLMGFDSDDEDKPLPKKKTNLTTKKMKKKRQPKVIVEEDDDVLTEPDEPDEPKKPKKINRRQLRGGRAEKIRKEEDKGVELKNKIDVLMSEFQQDLTHVLKEGRKMKDKTPLLEWWNTHFPAFDNDVMDLVDEAFEKDLRFKDTIEKKYYKFRKAQQGRVERLL